MLIERWWLREADAETRAVVRREKEAPEWDRIAELAMEAIGLTAFYSGIQEVETAVRRQKAPRSPVLLAEGDVLGPGYWIQLPGEGWGAYKDRVFGPLRQEIYRVPTEAIGKYVADRIPPIRGASAKLKQRVNAIVAANIETDAPRKVLEKDLAAAGQWSAARVRNQARTETSAMFNMGRFTALQGQQAVAGYKYMVVLDAATTDLCRGLAGKVIRKAELRAIPPLHYQCRTSLSPVFTFQKPVFDAASALPMPGEPPFAQFQGFGQPDVIAAAKSTSNEALKARLEKAEKELRENLAKAAAEKAAAEKAAAEKAAKAAAAKAKREAAKAAKAAKAAAAERTDGVHQPFGDFATRDDVAAAERLSDDMRLEGVTNASDAKRTVTQMLENRLEQNSAWMEYRERMLAAASWEQKVAGWGGRGKDGLVSSLIRQWAETSADKDARSIALQLAAEEEFGLVGSGVSHFYKPALKMAKEEYRINGAAYRAFVRAQYEETQAMFRAKGTKQVALSRGCVVEKTELAGAAVEGGAATEWDMALQPMNSFSMKLPTARNFAAGRGHDLENPQWVVMMVNVPVERIMSTFRTGNGCMMESEMVVLGGSKHRNKVRLVSGKVEPSFDLPSSTELLPKLVPYQ